MFSNNISIEFNNLLDLWIYWAAQVISYDLKLWLHLLSESDIILKIFLLSKRISDRERGSM